MRFNWKIFVTLYALSLIRRVAPRLIRLARSLTNAAQRGVKCPPSSFLNMFHLREIRRCETLSSALVCTDELHTRAAHHTLARNWGNWLNGQQISPLVHSARCVQPDE